MVLNMRSRIIKGLASGLTRVAMLGRTGDFKRYS